MTAEQQSGTEVHHRKRWIRRTAIYAGLLLVALIFDGPDFLNDILNYFRGEGCHPREISALAPPTYNRLLGWASKFQPVRVAVVTFHHDSEPVLVTGGRDYCQKRLFTAQLIQQIESLGASSIVLDELYDPGRCDHPLPPEPDGTKALLDVLSKSTIPITFAVDSDNVQGEAAKSKDIKACLVAVKTAVPAQDDNQCSGGPHQHCVKAGQDRLDEDTRRIPMRWQLFMSEPDSTHNETPASQPSLSLQAALQEDPRLKTAPDPRNAKKLGPLAKLLDEDDPEHPFTSFLEEGKIQVYPARQVLCGYKFDPQVADNWQSGCKPPDVENLPARKNNCTPFPTALSDERIYCDVRGKVVLIGEGEDDEHSSVVGDNTLGVVLHANYVQSLLDQRIFVPVNEFVTLGLYLAWFVVTNWFFWKPRPGSSYGPEIAFAKAALGLLLLFGVSWFVAWRFHVLIPVWWESSVSLAYIVLHWVEERAHHAGEEH